MRRSRAGRLHRVAVLAIATRAAHLPRRAVLGGVATCAAGASPAHARRGAAELDAEYYARSLIDRARGTTPDVFDARRARAAPVAPAARPVDAALLSAVATSGSRALAKAAGAPLAAIEASIDARRPSARKALAVRAARDLADGATSDAAGVDVCVEIGHHVEGLVPSPL